MAKAKALKMHKFATMFPQADDAEMEALREDIRKHGIKVKVVLFEGQILDGRSRYLIGRELGIYIPTEEFRGTARNALELATSFNLYRRHLSQSQKAMVAAEIAAELVASDGMPRAEAMEVAASAARVSKGYVQKAAQIIERDTQTANEIKNGETTIGSVYGHKTTCPRCGHRW